MNPSEAFWEGVQRGRAILPGLLRDPNYATLMVRDDVDSLAIAYLDNPDPKLRERILKLGGIQATNALTRIRLAAAGLCPPDRAPKLPAKWLAHWGDRFAAWTRLELAKALVSLAPPTPYRSDLEAPGAPWPEFGGSWGMTSLMSRFGASGAIESAQAWVNRHKDGPPLAAPFDCLDAALCRIATGQRDSTPRSSYGLSGRSSFPSVESTAAHGSLAWSVAEQSRCGGWAQFNKDQSAAAIASTPVKSDADLPCPGITGRVIEWLAPALTPTVATPAVQFLIDCQQQDGAWRSIWGRGRINGTYSALIAFAAAGKGEFDNEAHVLRGGEWLRSIQNADGGWGEDIHTGSPSPLSTPTHSAWAVLGLIAGADLTSSSLRAAARYLLDTQSANGAWTDPAPAAGGPGFEFAPNAFYPTLYATMALQRYSERALTHG